MIVALDGMTLLRYFSHWRIGYRCLSHRGAGYDVGSRSEISDLENRSAYSCAWSACRLLISALIKPNSGSPFTLDLSRRYQLIRSRPPFLRSSCSSSASWKRNVHDRSPSCSVRMRLCVLTSKYRDPNDLLTPMH